MVAARCRGLVVALASRMEECTYLKDPYGFLSVIGLHITTKLNNII